MNDEYLDYFCIETTAHTIDTMALACRIALEFQQEEELRNKYPALENAWNMYKMILKVCKDTE